MVKVSVIIPLFNAESVIVECLESVFSQSLDNIEVIVINDASTDDSVEVVNSYMKDHDLIFLKNEVNKGLPYTRNKGLTEAQGEYVFFLDSDDKIASNEALEKLYRLAIRTNSDEVIGKVSYWFPIDNSIQYGYFDLSQKYGTFFLKDVTQAPEVVVENCIATNKLIKRSFLLSNSLKFNEKLRRHEDNLFSFKVHALANGIAYLDELSYLYRQSGSGIMATKDPNRYKYLIEILRDSSVFYMQNRTRISKKFFKLFFNALFISLRYEIIENDNS